MQLVRAALHIHSRRTTLFLRKAIHQYSQALQRLQGEAQPEGRSSVSPGNEGDLLSVSVRDHCAFQTHPGTPCALSRMFRPDTENSTSIEQWCHVAAGLNSETRKPLGFLRSILARVRCQARPAIAKKDRVKSLSAPKTKKASARR